MKSKEKIKDLIKRYFEGKISDQELENLYFILHDEECEDPVISEAYLQWGETSSQNDQIPSGQIFRGIRSKVKLSKKKLNKDELILKGLEYSSRNTWKSRLNSIYRHAAVFVLGILTSALVYYVITERGNQETALNEISIPNGSKIKVVLSDSSEVWLNSGSTLRYPDAFCSGQREVFLEGEAFFNIREHAGKPFFVRTTDLNIKVLGTQFNVRNYPGDDLVVTTLVEGKLEIEGNEYTGRKTDHILLLANQKAFYSKKSHQIRLGKLEPIQSIRKISQLSPEASVPVETIAPDIIHDEVIETSWKDNRLIFRDEKFSSLAKKLERWYGVEIRITDENAKDLRFSGTIKGETIEQTMDALSLASTLEYRMEQNKLEIYMKTITRN